MIKALASERARIGMTQEEAAAHLGCSVKSLSLYENNVRGMPAEIVNSAADLYGCSTDYIYGRTKDRLPRDVHDDRQAS